MSDRRPPPILYARVAPAVHDEVRAVAELAGVSMATVVETVLSWRLGLPTSGIGNAVTRAILTRKKTQR